MKHVPLDSIEGTNEFLTELDDAFSALEESSDDSLIMGMIHSRVRSEVSSSELELLRGILGKYFSINGTTGFIADKNIRHNLYTDTYALTLLPTSVESTGMPGEKLFVLISKDKSELRIVTIGFIAPGYSFDGAPFDVVGEKSFVSPFQ